MRCPKANCGGTIDIRTDGLGRVAYSCARCTRKKARLCRDCPARTPTPRSWRCAVCAKQHRHAFQIARDRQRYAKRRAAVLAAHERRRRDPIVREHRKRYMAAYRIANPRDEHDRAYGREYMRTRRADPAYRVREQRRKRARRRHTRQAGIAA